MSKSLKKFIIIVLVLAVLGVGGYFGAQYVYNSRRAPVNVYRVQDFSMTDYWGDSLESGGNVKADNLQKVYLSSTQTVSSVFVEEGQNVTKGQKLLSYDTTLTALDVQKAQIAYEKKQQSYDEAQKLLEKYQKMQSKEQLELKKQELTTKLNAAKTEARKLASQTDLSVVTPIIPSEQDGSKEKPIYTKYDQSFSLSALESTYATTAGQEVYVVLYEEYDGIPSAYQGVYLKNTDGNISMSFFPAPELKLPDDAANADQKVKEIQKELDAIELLLMEPHTYVELQKMILDQTQKVKEEKLGIEIAKLDLNKKSTEVKDGAVYAEIDGIVKKVRTTEEANENNGVIVEISAGGGYYITAPVSELQLDKFTIGSTCNVNSWMSGAFAEGTVQEISTYPSTSTGYSSGNNNVSWYPMTIFVDDSANLQEGEYVQLTFQQNMEEGSGSSFYLENEFIRRQSGKSYVYIRNSDGLLEQRFLQTGKDVWGSYTEIRGGLTVDDYIAFPYGNDVMDGAKTNEATADQLYNGY